MKPSKTGMIPDKPRTASVAWCRIDAEGAIREANEAFVCRAALPGISCVLGKKLWDLFTVSAVGQGNATESVVPLTELEGAFTNFSDRYRLTPIELECGESICIFNRSTDNVECTQRLKEAEERIRQVESMKNAFLATISHEVRTPINIIVGYANLIGAQYHDLVGAEESFYFTCIDNAANRLIRTIDDLINLASIQSGTYQVTKSRFPISARVRGLVDRYGALAEQHGLALHFSSDCPYSIEADPYCFDQAFCNVLDNAVKFTTHGSIDVCLISADHECVMTVTDTGIGIAEEYLAKLFDPFSQEVTGYSRPYEGLGVGLALTKQFVHVNGGSVTVHSRKNEGTIVTFRYPVIDGERHIDYLPPHKSGIPRQHHGTLVPEHALTILIVEDDRQTQEFLRIVLSRAYNVVVTSSAAEAKEILGMVKVHLILMDLSLHGDMDGLELTRELRADERYCTVPIIALTAHAFQKDRDACIEAGCDEYVSKPFQMAQLNVLIRSLLGGSIEEAAEVTTGDKA